MKTSGITRRGLIRGAAAGAAIAALPKSTQAATLTADVIVVGAGLAGLTAARAIAAAGRSVLVVDERARRRAVDGVERRRLGSADARRVAPREYERQLGVPGGHVGGHRSDLRLRATRAVAALHALLHRGLGERAERRNVRAELQHRGRRPGEPL